MRWNVMNMTLLAGVAAACLNGQMIDYRNIKNPPIESALKFQFTIRPANVTSGSIASAGSRAITVRPCPLGVAGNKANHNVRISGGVGTAETVLLGLKINSVTNANPAVVTTAFAHGLTSGDSVTPYGFTGNWTSFQVARTVTVLSPTTYSVSFDTTSLGAVTGTPRITYGTCTSGASSGTIAVTTVNSHSGSWTITSATAGIQEAFNSMAPVDIFVPDGAWTIYGKIQLYGQGGNTTRIVGAGAIATRLIRASDFLDGDLINYDGNLGAGDLILEDFGIVNGSASVVGTGGSAIHLKDSYTTNISRVWVTDGYRQLHFEGTSALTHVDSGEFRYTAAYTAAAAATGNVPSEAILISSATVNFTNNEVVQSISTSTAGAPVFTEAFPSIKITRGDGHTFENNRIGGLDGIQIAHDGVNPMNFIYIKNNVINGFYRFGVYFTNAASGGVEFQNFIISNNDIIAQFLYPPFTVASTLSGGITDVATTLTVASSTAFKSGNVVIIDSEMILLGTVVGATATGCTRGYNSTVAAAHLAAATVSAAGPLQHIGINADNALLVGVEVTGNLIAGLGYSGIKVNNGKYWNITGNTIRDNNASNSTGSGIELNGTGVGNTVTGNFSGYAIVSGAGLTRYAYQTAGLYVTGSQTNFTVTGNNFAYNSVLPIALVSSPTITGILDNNTGVDDGFETIASATSITSLRFGRSINLTGTTAITTILPTWSGKRIRFNKTDAGTIAIGGGGNIASTSVNLVQYGTVDCTFNGPQGAWFCR